MRTATTTDLSTSSSITMHLSLALLLSLSLLAACEPSGPPLPGVPSTRLPVSELSGLARRGDTLVGVGDASARIGFLDLATGTTRNAILPLPARSQGSQLEGVTFDASGHLWCVEEDPGSVYVVAVDGEAATLLHTFHIVMPQDDPLHAAWAADPNARAEGLALLGGGHVLIAKQRKPVRLVELGPDGDAPRGLPSGAMPVEDGALPDEAESDLVPLAEWGPAGDDETKAIADVSDLDTEDDGLWLLAGRSHRVAELVRPLDPASATFAVTATRHLGTPIGGLVFEGLAFGPEGELYLGVDRKGADPNVSIIAP